MSADNNSDNGNNGNRGRFSDRLKRMRRERLKKSKNASLNIEESTIKTVGRNTLKIILALPSVVYTNVVKDSEKTRGDKRLDENKKVGRATIGIKDKAESVNSRLQNVDVKSDSIDSKESVKSDVRESNKKSRISEIRDIDVPKLKKKREEILRSVYLTQNPDIKDTTMNIEIELRKVQLQKEIIDLIKKKLVNSINELEILQSELYVLHELDAGDTYLNECQQDIKEIKKMLSKVKALKEKYDHLKDNVDFEYMLEFGDDFLIDKILELKELCSRDDIRQTVDDYKILDEYKFLYLKIDKLQEDTIKFEEEKSRKAEELKQRDIDFDKLKDDIYDVDRENDRYNNFVKKQELFLRELEENISHIDSHESVTYRLKGFNQLLGNSFKYLGLLLANPLKGLVPGIATQTLVTKNLVHNMYKNLEWEENRRMVYEAIDYSASINAAINSLDSTASLVDSTLEDIVRLKNKYMKDFSRYELSFSSYQDAIKKINKIENAVLGSKIKIERMRQRMKEKERQNSNKMKLVKKLNASGNKSSGSSNNS